MSGNNPTRRQTIIVPQDPISLSLRKKLFDALESPGIQTSIVGNVDLKSITTSALVDVLAAKSTIYTIISEEIDQLFSLAQLMLNIRTAYQSQDWDAVSSILEQIIDVSSSGKIPSIPDLCRQEIQIIRYEVENRWIISNVTSALMQGRLKVISSVNSTPSSPIRGSNDEYKEEGEVDLQSVSFNEIATCLEICRSIGPRTPEASRLVYTAEIVLWVRQRLLQSSDRSAWQDLADKIDGYMSSDDIFMVNPIAYPELRLAMNTAKDYLLCERLEDALGRGNVGGHVGQVDLTETTTVELNSCVENSSTVSAKTERARGLLYYCRTLCMLRDILLKIYSNTSSFSQPSPKPLSSTTIQSWKKIREILQRFQIEAPIIQSSSSAWNRCKEELLLISRAAQVHEIRERLEDSCHRSIIKYHHRNSIDIKSIEFPYTSSQFHNSSSVYVDVDNELILYDLESILDSASQLRFKSKVLSSYEKCVDILHQFRKAIMNLSIDVLDDLVNSSSMDALSILDVAVKEGNLIMKEYRNIASIRQLESVLLPIDSTIYTEKRLLGLKRAIDQIDTYSVTCLASQQLLECAKHIFLLRHGIYLQNSEQTMSSLRWFEKNSHRCPESIIDEIKTSYQKYQNDILTTHLKIALSRGKFRPSVKFETSSIDINELHELINQASELGNGGERSPEVSTLVYAAEIAYRIRKAQIDKDIPTLKKFLNSLSSEIGDITSGLPTIHPLVFDEIAIARREVDNEISVGVLTFAIQSFFDPEIKLPSFLSSYFPAHKSMSKLSDKRRYTYQNAVQDQVDIEISNYDIDILDKAMKIATQHGLHSQECRSLYKTSGILHLIREAIKASDWLKVKDILDNKIGNIATSNITNYTGRAGVVSHCDIHPLAKFELEAIRKQLELRSAILEVSRALKEGRAQCSNGVVDTTTVNITLLAQSIASAESSFRGTHLSIQKHSLDQIDIDNIKKPFELKEIQNQTHLLIESAKVVTKTRELLLLGKLEEAGVLADNYSQTNVLHPYTVEELSSYSREISKAMHLMKLSASLKAARITGDVDILAALLLEAKESGSIERFRYDLGLVRVLENARRVLCQWKACYSKLLICKQNFELKAMQNAVEEATAIGLKGEILEQIKGRAARVSQFEELIKEAYKATASIPPQRKPLAKFVQDLAIHLNLPKHPAALRASLLLSMPPSALRIVSICQGIKERNSSTIATETARLKRAYLSMSSSTSKYLIENFPGLRNPTDFELLSRNPVASRDNDQSMKLMLSHSSSSLHTSLTLLSQSPVYAAVAVWTFNHVIRGIERNLYSSPEVQLKSLLKLGRMLPPIRDEIFLQIIKQYRGNKDSQSLNRLLKLLAACARHFPPSAIFENYLESFLLQESQVIGLGKEGIQAASYRSSICKQCIRFMHESIIRYGYNAFIQDDLPEGTLKQLRHWLDSSSIYLPGYSPVYIPFQSGTISLPESFSLSNYLTAMQMPLAVNDISPESYLSLDLAFETIDLSMTAVHTLGAISSSTNNGSMYIRGCRENWMRRFSLLSGTFTTARRPKPPSVLSEEEFATAFADNRTPIDPLDKALLIFLVFGYDTELRGPRWNQLVRELQEEKECLHFKNDAEQAASKARVLWLRQHIIIPKPSGQISFNDISYDDVLEEAKFFWSKYISTLHEDASENVSLKWNTIGETIKAKIKLGNQEVSLPSFEMPAPQTWESIAQGKADINWELYHDIIVASMQIFVETRVLELNESKRQEIPGFFVTDM